MTLPQLCFILIQHWRCNFPVLFFSKSNIYTSKIFHVIFEANFSRILVSIPSLGILSLNISSVENIEPDRWDFKEKDIARKKKNARQLPSSPCQVCRTYCLSWSWGATNCWPKQVEQSESVKRPRLGYPNPSFSSSARTADRVPSADCSRYTVGRSNACS